MIPDLGLCDSCRVEGPTFLCLGNGGMMPEHLAHEPHASCDECDRGKGCRMVAGRKIPVVADPWMQEFVKGRHSQEEWEAFFKYAQAYFEAGPIKRFFMRASLIVGAVFEATYGGRGWRS